MIPKITHELGKYWDQPNPENIAITATDAYMSEDDYNKLGEYNHSIPSGTYAGKMWRRYMQLCWYEDDPANDAMMLIRSRQIVIVGTRTVPSSIKKRVEATGFKIKSWHPAGDSWFGHGTYLRKKAVVYVTDTAIQILQTVKTLR